MNFWGPFATRIAREWHKPSATDLTPQGTLDRAPLMEYHKLYADACLPSKEWVRCKLEALRYKWGTTLSGRYRTPR